MHLRDLFALALNDLRAKLYGLRVAEASLHAVLDGNQMVGIIERESCASSTNAWASYESIALQTIVLSMGRIESGMSAALGLTGGKADAVLSFIAEARVKGAIHSLRMTPRQKPLQY